MGSLSWADDGVAIVDEQGERQRIVQGPVALAADTGEGLVYQRPEGRDDRPGGVLWFDGSSGPREIVNVDAAESLELVGAVPASPLGEPPTVLAGS